MTSIRPAIRQYVSDLLRDGHDVVRHDAADQFISDHPDEIAGATEQLVRDAIAAAMRQLCSERPEDTGQLTLLPGLPAAVSIAPGVVRPLNRCTWADLEIGRSERVENIANAEKRLDEYDADAELLRPLLEGRPDLTVGDVRHLLATAAAS